MKKFTIFLLIFFITISTFASIEYSDKYDISTFSDIPKPGTEKK